MRKSISAVAAFFVLLAIAYKLKPAPNYLEQIPIAFTESKIPFALIEIEGVHYPIQVNLGSKFQLALKDPYAIVDKKQTSSIQWKNKDSILHESKQFLLPKIKLGAKSMTDIVFTHLDHAQKDLQGVLGWKILEKTNLAFDLRHRLIYATNRIHNLAVKGYDVSAFIQVPFRVTRAGLVIDGETDMGIKKFTLNTSVVTSLISRTLIHGPVFCSRIFKMAGHDFGMLDLHAVHLPDELSAEEDGVLGLDFFRTHVVYIDFPSKTLYIGPVQNR